MNNQLVSKVELHFQCIGLKNADTFSKSDPFVVVSARTTAPGPNQKAQFTEVWRSSTAENNLNPSWTDAAILDYHFEEVQHFRFEVFDRDSSNDKLKKHNFLGRVDTTMSKIMGARGSTFSSLLNDKKGRVGKLGKIIVRGKEQSSCKDIVEFQFQAEKLERKNMMGLGRSDPFYIVSQLQADGTFLKVFEGEAIKSTTKPFWKVQKALMSTICSGDRFKKLKIEVFDFESDGAHQFIGAFETSVDDMMTTRNFMLTKPGSSKSKGTFIINKCKVLERFSFLEYVQGGCEIKLSVAIDFTGSNGHPADQGSLHYMPPQFHFTGDYDLNSMNEYQKALISVGQVVQDYDSDKMMTALGFGANLANLPNGGSMNMHAFPLSLDPSRPELHGIPEIMEAYKNCLAKTTLSGPTHFSDLIEVAMKNAFGVSQAEQSYSILLILTDGVINDMERTIEKLVEASGRALSVIIVGVGAADFEAMNELDADGSFLQANGKRANRDLVQFVPYRKFSHMGFTRLAEETLKEVPKQVEEYFSLRGIRPNKARPPPQAHYQISADEMELMNQASNNENVPVVSAQPL